MTYQFIYSSICYSSFREIHKKLKEPFFDPSQIKLFKTQPYVKIKEVNKKKFEINLMDIPSPEEFFINFNNKLLTSNDYYIRDLARHNIPSMIRMTELNKIQSKLHLLRRENKINYPSVNMNTIHRVSVDFNKIMNLATVNKYETIIKLVKKFK